MAQALLPVRLCQADDFTDGVCPPIAGRRFSNRERIAIFHPHFHTLAQEGRWPTTRPPKVQPRLHPLYSSFQPRASSLQNLIANPELESRLTYRKLSPLKISNRKYIAIFYLNFAIGLLTRAVERRFVPAGTFVTEPDENTSGAQEPRSAARSAEPFGLPRPVQASQPRPAE